MPRLAITAPSSIDARVIGSVLAERPRARAGATDGALFVAKVASEALMLGAHQRATSTLDLSRPEVATSTVARRTTGGVALHVRPGQVFVALDLASASVLGGGGDPARAINRHVRPLLAALGALGVAAIYGGRDVVVAGGAPVAWMGVTHDPSSGSIALEAIVAVDAPFGLDPALDLAHGSIAPRFLGKTPGTLSSHARRSVDVAAVVRAIVEQWSSLADGETIELAAASLPAMLAPLDQRPFDALVEEGMGLVGAAIEPELVAIGGELMVSQGALEGLGGVLHRIGDVPTGDLALEAAIDAALGPSSGAMLFGVKSLASIAKVVRAAHARRR